MRLWYFNSANPETTVYEVEGDRVSIGRGSDNDIVLDSSFVPHKAVQLELKSDRWILNCVGGSGCDVDNKRVIAGEGARLGKETNFAIFPYSFSFKPIEQKKEEQQEQRQLDARVNDAISDLHTKLLSQAEHKLEEIHESLDGEIKSDDVLQIEHDIETICVSSGILEDEDLVFSLSGRYVRAKILASIFAGTQTDQAPQLDWSKNWSAIAQYERQLDQITSVLERNMKLANIIDLSERAETVEDQFWNYWKEESAGRLVKLLKRFATQEVQKQLKDIIFGYGPIEDLRRTPTIDEIMVIGRDKIFVEKNGSIENSGRQFINNESLDYVIERIVSRTGGGREINTSSPLVDTRLTDGSRVNIAISPIALDGPLITIRKFREQKLTVQQLVDDYQSITPTAVEFLEAIVGNRCNILVAGGTGSGKTTLLNCLSQFISDKERIVTIEDTAELALSKNHVCRMETKVKNCEGQGGYEIGRLLINSLRMRPDRIIVGECRGEEAIDMLQAMNTGHDGSMTTLHANSPEDVVLRLEVMVLKGANLPVRSIRQQIGSAVDFIVQLNKFPVAELDGNATLGNRRIVSHISEVAGFDERTGNVRLKDIFSLGVENGKKRLMPTGNLPSNMDHLVKNGLHLNKLFPTS